MLLQSIWFFIWGLLWAVFFMTDGFDLGVGTLYPYLGKTEHDKRVMINAVGPLWDGNEVWLITAGGVTFAAFPMVYAFMFSTLYTPLMLILFCLILRGAAFEFRGKLNSTAWKKIWDTCIFAGSAVPSLLFGIVFANIFQGIPFDMAGDSYGSLITLLNPYGITGGVFFVLLFLVHGSLWLALKSEGGLKERTAMLASNLWYVLGAVAVSFLAMTWFATHLYDNYLKTPFLFVIPACSVVSLAGIKIFEHRGDYFKAWVMSAMTIGSAVLFGVTGLFPNLYPSRITPAFNLTAFNASSSRKTLGIMLIVAAIFIPIVVLYQAWAYKLFSGKITAKDLEQPEAY